jgi:Tfp pilus assembly protein PilV
MSLPFLPRRSGRESGFSFVEVLIALVLVGTALLMGMGLALQNPRIVKRLDGERQAFRALESTLEAVRAGAIPLQTSELDGFVTAVGTPAELHGRAADGREDAPDAGLEPSRGAVTRRAARTSGQAGFTLVETCISLVLMVLALLLAAQVLMETSQIFAETSGEALDTPVPLVIARIRADVQGSTGAFPIPDADGALDTVVIQGLGRQVHYRKQGDALFRTIVPQNGDPPEKPMLLWPGVTGWGFQVHGSNLVELTVTYRRRTVPRSPLPTLPGLRGPVTEELTQKMYLLPRGAGLGDTW